jgi:tRNA threonylcarbamoyladenosine biosynthesis protein TsaE
MTRVVRTQSEAETSLVGARVAATLEPGTVVLLTGDLGTGKTAFVRGMAEGLGIDPDDISSPSFTLIQEYRPSTRPGRPEPAGGGGRRVLSHVDLYRVEGAEIEDLGLEELGDAGAVVAIEWAEKLRDAPADAIRVEILDRGGDSREIRITGPDTR